MSKIPLQIAIDKLEHIFDHSDVNDEATGWKIRGCTFYASADVDWSDETEELKASVQLDGAAVNSAALMIDEVDAILLISQVTYENLGWKLQIEEDINMCGFGYYTLILPSFLLQDYQSAEDLLVTFSKHLEAMLKCVDSFWGTKLLNLHRELCHEKERLDVARSNFPELVDKRQALEDMLDDQRKEALDKACGREWKRLELGEQVLFGRSEKQDPMSGLMFMALDTIPPIDALVETEVGTLKNPETLFRGHKHVLAEVDGETICFSLTAVEFVENAMTAFHLALYEEHLFPLSPLQYRILIGSPKFSGCDFCLDSCSRFSAQKSDAIVQATRTNPKDTDKTRQDFPLGESAETWWNKWLVLEGRWVWGAVQSIPFHYQSVIEAEIDYLRNLLHSASRFFPDTMVGILPWEVLSDEEFEELCYELIIHDEQFVNVQKTGKSRAADAGLDIVAHRKQPLLGHEVYEKWGFQCKHISASFGRGAAIGLGILETANQHHLDGYGILISNDFTTEAMALFDSLNQRGLRIVWYDRRHLERLLGKYSDLVLKFFARNRGIGR